MSTERVVYSIQRTYILKPVLTSGNVIITCDERIDIPTIEPLSQVKTVLTPKQPATFVPCIELAGEFLSEVNLTFETNEGVTVLPIEITSGQGEEFENPYTHFRYVLVLPRGATGVKSCKVTFKDRDEEVQHNFTFSIMPPPYNYDNALFVDISYYTLELLKVVSNLTHKVNNLALNTKTPVFEIQYLPKGMGKQTINIKNDIKHGALFYETVFSYPLLSEPTMHKPKITLHSDDGNQVYTLSLNKTRNAVSIDLFTGVIRVCDRDNGEIIQQFMLNMPYINRLSFDTLSFENFDDISASHLIVDSRGALVE